MTRALLPLLSCALALFAPATHAQSVPEGSRAASLLAQAEAECKALDPDAPARLDIAPDAVSWVDLDGDEARDDAIVDFNAIYCSISGTLWHGTGGAPVHALMDALNSGTDHAWTGWGWQVVQHGEGPVLLLQRHGTACGGSGAERCIMAVTFGPEGARVIDEP